MHAKSHNFNADLASGSKTQRNRPSNIDTLEMPSGGRSSNVSPGVRSTSKQAQQDYIASKLYKPKYVPKDKTAEQYEFERNKAELSFQPYFFTKAANHNSKQAKKVMTKAKEALPGDKALIKTARAVPAKSNKTLVPAFEASSMAYNKGKIGEKRQQRNYANGETGGIARSPESSGEFRSNVQATTGGFKATHF